MEEMNTSSANAPEDKQAPVDSSSKNVHGVVAPEPHRGTKRQGGRRGGWSVVKKITGSPPESVG